MASSSGSFTCPGDPSRRHAAPGPAGLYPHVLGLIMSVSTDIDVIVHGRGGHGSRPETTVDLAVTAVYGPSPT